MIFRICQVLTHSLLSYSLFFFQPSQVGRSVSGTLPRAHTFLVKTYSNFLGHFGPLIKVNLLHPLVLILAVVGNVDDQVNYHHFQFQNLIPISWTSLFILIQDHEKD